MMDLSLRDCALPLTLESDGITQNQDTHRWCRAKSRHVQMILAMMLEPPLDRARGERSI